MFKKYANNAFKFSIAASSQVNESVNNMISRKAPKNICLSKSAACDFRVASAICCKNDGEISLLDIKKKITLSPGIHTQRHAERVDKLRKKKSEKIRTKAQKVCRQLLAREREKLRKSNEKSGVRYESNYGINSTVPIDFQMANNNYIVPQDCKVIYSNLETSGFHTSAEILQIAAKCKEKFFNIYVNPTQMISEVATKVTGLSFISG